MKTSLSFGPKAHPSFPLRPSIPSPPSRFPGLGPLLAWPSRTPLALACLAQAPGLLPRLRGPLLRSPLALAQLAHRPAQLSAAAPLGLRCTARALPLSLTALPTPPVSHPHVRRLPFPFLPCFFPFLAR